MASRLSSTMPKIMSAIIWTNTGQILDGQGNKVLSHNALCLHGMPTKNLLRIFPLCEKFSPSLSVGVLTNWWSESHVLQIIDEKTALIRAEWGSHDARFFLEAPIVANLQEGQSLKGLSDTFLVEGTRQYRMALGGVSTVPILSAYDLKPHLAKLKRDRPQ